MLDFVVEHIWVFIIVGAIIILTAIGYIVDKFVIHKDNQKESVEEDSTDDEIPDVAETTNSENQVPDAIEAANVEEQIPDAAETTSVEEQTPDATSEVSNADTNDVVEQDNNDEKKEQI